MKVTIYALIIDSTLPANSPTHKSFYPPNQNATTVIGHPQNRRTAQISTKEWIVVTPDPASLVGAKLKWIEDGTEQLLTAQEVYSLAMMGLDGFYFADGGN